MPNRSSNIENIADKLARSIASDVGTVDGNELETISSRFDKTLANVLDKFNSEAFDDDGFIRKMNTLDIDGSNDVVKNVLNSVKSDHRSLTSMHQTEVLLRRDISNVCYQMPEMRDVIYLTRDNIIEANIATGEVSRTLQFKNIKGTETYESQVQELEERFGLLTAIKDFIIPPLLMNGEMYVHVVPYSKLFAELEAINSKAGRGGIRGTTDYSRVFSESIPNGVMESFHEVASLDNASNVSLLMESVTKDTKVTVSEDNASSMDKSRKSNDTLVKEEVSSLLKNIEVYTGASTLMAEYGKEGLETLLHLEYMDDMSKRKQSEPMSELEKFTSYMESYMSEDADASNIFNRIDQDDIHTKTYDSIKGCYIQYMDALKMIPIRLGRRVIGYYYVTTTTDLTSNPATPNGIVDLSYQHYTNDKNVVDRLASMIISAFDKKFLDKNIRLKNEIADIVMAHKFSDGKLSFVYIPESEIVRFTIDEDADGKGHSMIEPTLFSARSYLMLNMYNLLYTLNNTTTRIHYLKSSGLNKNYAAQIQRAIRKFQSRRITVDDIYSYSGVLNKVGGMGEMVLPSGRAGDYKAIETDTIEAALNPINLEMIEQQRRQALSGTGAPNLLIINAIDEVDFAKTVELANARYQSRCGALKINVNKGSTILYQRVMKACTNIDDSVIRQFRFILNNSKQQELNITSEMISNYNQVAEVVMNSFGGKHEWEDDKGNPTNLQIQLRKSLIRKYLPQLDPDELEDIVNDARLAAKADDLRDKVATINIDSEDLEVIKSKKK